MYPPKRDKLQNFEVVDNWSFFIMCAENLNRASMHTRYK